MVYENSYESGRKPFRPDTTRGYWAQPQDFIWANLAQVLKMDIFSMSWMFLSGSGFLPIIPYMMCLFVYVVPLMVLQSFMGQFSSSGFISSFRLAPIFKGMGYVCLTVNIVVLYYYTVLAAVPMFFFLNSLRPTLPWSCDAAHEWSKNLKGYQAYNLCNITISNLDRLLISNNENSSNEDVSALYPSNHYLPSVLYFNHHFNALLFYEDNPIEVAISFEMAMCILLVWAIVATVFHYCQQIDKFGVFLRYGFCTCALILLICLIPFSFLEGASQAYNNFFTLEHLEFKIFLPDILVHVMNCFGGGWGTVTTLASFNKFKTDIMSYSWIICTAQLFVMLAFYMLIQLTELHFIAITDDNFQSLQHVWILFLGSASALTHLSFANFWSLLFYGMLTLSGIMLISTQLLTILTSLFDEFELLRAHKHEVTYGTIGIFALSSLYFSTNFGLIHFSALSADALFTQTMVSILIIFIVLWIYGRERFQRDIEFMLNKPFGSWRIFMLRFIAPIFLLIVLCCTIFLVLWENLSGSDYFGITTLIHSILPWLFLPGYVIYLLIQSSGPLLMRLKRACRPHDWYPVESDQRQNYEEAMHNMDITHQLTEVMESADVLSN